MKVYEVVFIEEVRHVITVTADTREEAERIAAQRMAEMRHYTQEPIEIAGSYVIGRAVRTFPAEVK